MTPIVAQLIERNAGRWNAMQVWPHLRPRAEAVATRLVNPSAKAIYEWVSEKSLVPWPIIAVIHEREASQSWKDSIAQGDPWDRPSVNIPRGRGPFKDWFSAALDALTECPPFAAHWPDWSIGGALTLLEQYNGLGYAHRNLASPYVWASTNQYESGKYTRDGHFDPYIVDQQMGCAALLREMMTLDASIKWGGT